jgi:hypothetical protein
MSCTSSLPVAPGLFLALSNLSLYLLCRTQPTRISVCPFNFPLQRDSAGTRRILLIFRCRHLFPRLQCICLLTLFPLHISLVLPRCLHFHTRHSNPTLHTELHVSHPTFRSVLMHFLCTIPSPLSHTSRAFQVSVASAAGASNSVPAPVLLHPPRPHSSVCMCSSRLM